ncbi:MAG: AMP-binding protein [Rhodocyclaceae bacterium]
MKISDLSFDLSVPATGEAGTPPAQQAMPQQEALHDGALVARLLGALRRHASRPAVCDSGGRLSFGELDALSARIARFIRQHCPGTEVPVAVMGARNRFFIAAMLGIWRAGAVHVPLDPSLPLARRAQMLQQCAAPLLIVDAAQAGAGERLQYRCPQLQRLLCPQVGAFGEALERPGELMSLELWHHVTASAADGSWKSYFDGQALPESALQGLADNLLGKLADELARPCRVLDVGSGAGRVAQALMQASAHYTALDLSRHELDRIERLAAGLGVRAETHQMEAIDLHLLPTGAYDLITLNCVAENFPGFNYLRRVLDHAMNALDEGGCLFVGGVWDLAQRPRFLDDLRAHAARTGDSRGWLRLEADQELFVPREVFSEWARSAQADARAQGKTLSLALEFSEPRIACDELRVYRYDVTIRRVAQTVTPDSGVDVASPPVRRRFGAADLPPAEAGQAEAQEQGQGPGRGPGQGVAPPVEAGQAAYIIFTSGSTGQPKGVVVAHRALLNLADGVLARVYAPHGEAALNVAVLASFSFDASLQQIVPALLGGHCLHPVDDEVRRNPDALHTWLENGRIDVCDGTPSLFSLLVDYWADHDRQAPAQCFILGGEVLRADLLQRFYRIPGHARCILVNAYGPTECCVDATLQFFDVHNHARWLSPPIGQPLPGVRVSVRDRHGQGLPDGVPGELWIAGTGLARGYLGDEALTASRFVQADGARWYRSGDQVRRQADGLLFYIGREDQQVKLGGYRVELGEVEAALNRAPGVRAAVVGSADFAGRGVNTLAAYVVCEGELDAGRLRAFLANHLPAHAIPTHFVAMDSLPVSGSGKIDRKSLPSPLAFCTADASRHRPAGRPPEGECELALAGLWAQLLGRDVPDAQSDFFELGGHSVLGIRLISLIEKRFGHRLSLSRLFQAPTIAALATVLAEQAGGETYTPVVELAPGGAGAPLFLFHPVGGSVFCYRGLAQQLAGPAPVHAVEAPGFQSDWPMLPTVEEMASRYLEAMLVTLGGRLCPVVLAGWSFGGLVAFEVARQLRARGGELTALVLIDTVADNRVARELVQKDEVAMLLRLFGELLPVSEAEFRAREADDRLDYLIGLGTEHGMLPSGFSRQQMRRLLQTFHNNALASARYDAPALDAGALLVRPRELSSSAMTLVDDPLQGWGGRLLRGVELEWVGGNHETMLTDLHVAEVAGHMRRYLERMGA